MNTNVKVCCQCIFPIQKTQVSQDILLLITLGEWRGKNLTLFALLYAAYYFLNFLCVASAHSGWLGSDSCVLET